MDSDTTGGDSDVIKVSVSQEIRRFQEEINKVQAENVKFYQWKLKRCKVLPVPSPRKAHCHQMIQNKFYIISSAHSLIFSENILMIRIIEGFNICNLHRQFVEQQHQEERSEESVLLWRGDSVREQREFRFVSSNWVETKLFTAVQCVRVKSEPDLNNNEEVVSDRNVVNSKENSDITRSSESSAEEENLVLPSVKNLATLFQDVKINKTQNNPTICQQPPLNKSSEAGSVILQQFHQLCQRVKWIFFRSIYPPLCWQ